MFQDLEDKVTGMIVVEIEKTENSHWSLFEEGWGVGWFRKNPLDLEMMSEIPVKCPNDVH